MTIEERTNAILAKIEEINQGGGAEALIAVADEAYQEGVNTAYD